MKKKIIIYDFDGVICHSVNLKTEAFIELYKNHSSHIQSLVRSYHLENGGISRFHKIRYFQTQLLGLPYSEYEVNELAKQFASIVKEKVIESPFINGVINFLEKHVRNSNQFICTGTPELEIKEIVIRKNINKYFSGIYGSPKTKIEIIKKILSDTSVQTDDCIFIGDALTDFNAAKVCNIPFIGMKNLDTVFPEKTFTINDFNDQKLTTKNL